MKLVEMVDVGVVMLVFALGCWCCDVGVCITNLVFRLTRLLSQIFPSEGCACPHRIPSLATFCESWCSACGTRKHAKIIHGTTAFALLAAPSNRRQLQANLGIWSLLV